MSKPTQTRVQFRHTLSQLRARVFIAVLTLFVLTPVITTVYSITRAGDSAGTRAYAVAPGTMNFQARLLNASGSIAPDGNYHVEFKLYDASSGGTLEWTETRTTGNLVPVKAGYLSVNLGSVTAFGGGIDWTKQHWLTMNIGGTGGSASWDGEMSPRIQLTAVPYAMAAAQAAQAQTLNKNTGSFTGTVDFSTLTANRTYLFPDTALATTASPGTICVYNGSNSNCPAASGSNFYIQNTAGSATPQTGANFNIQATDSTTNGTVAGILRGAAGGQTADLLQFQNTAGSVLARFTAGGHLGLNANASTSMLSIVTDSTSTIGNIIKGSSGQTADLLQLQDSTGAVISAITSAGNLKVASSVDTSAAGALNVGNSTATSVSICNSAACDTFDVATNADADTVNIGDSSDTLNFAGTAINLTGDTNITGNVTVAAGKYLKLTGDVTASRPASPTEGTLFYDTTTKQLLIYANGKWQADRSTATKIVAASNSSQAAKDAADYVATGTGDQTQINNALTAAAGGRVYLLEGTYTLSASISIPNNTILMGSGQGTLITIPNSVNANFVAITNSDTSTGAGITVRDLRLDGNKSNQSGAGIGMAGIGLIGVGGSGRSGATVINVRSDNWYFGSGGSACYFGAGVCFSNTFYSTISGSSATGDQNGLLVVGGSSYNTVTGNTVESSTADITLSGVADNTVTGNATHGGSYGLYVFSASRNSITGNTISGATVAGVYLLTNANTNVVSGNRLYDNGGATTNNAIYVSNSDNNTLTGNSVTDTSATTNNYAINVSDNTSDNTYLGANYLGAGSINDAGTGTIFGGQVNSAGNYLIQPTGTIELLKNTNVTGNLAVTGTGSFTGGSVTVATTTATDDRIITSVTTGGGARFDGTITNADLTAARTWTLPDASGTFAVSASGNIALSSTGNITLTGQVPIANGGTGAATSQAAINALSQLTTNGDLLYNDGTNSTRLARGTNGQCLTSNATTLVWASCVGSESDTLASVTARGATTTTASSFNGGASIRGLTVDTATATDDRILTTVTAGGSNRFDGTITNADLTAARTWTLPDATGTVITTGNLSQITATGTITSGTWQGTAVADTYVADNITINSSGTVDWTALNNYPAACAAGSAVTQLGDTVTCSAFATGTAANYIQNGTSVQTAANFYIRSAATGSVAGVIEGANGQTANLLDLNTYNGTVSTTVASFTAAGDLKVASAVDTQTATTLNIGTTNATGIIIGKTSGQTLRLGQNGGTVQIDGTNFDVSTAGVVTLAGGQTTDITTAGATTLKLDTGGAAALSVGTANANAVSISRTGVTTTVNGALTVGQLLTGQLGATLYGANVDINASSNFNTNINTGTSTGTISIGNSAAGAITLQSGSTVGITAGTTISLTSTGANNINLTPGGGSNTGVLVKPTTDSTAAFQVQNAAGTASIMTADTTNGALVLGTSNALSGKLVFRDSGDSNSITINAPAITSASYSLTLPTSTPTTGLCIATSQLNANQLVFTSCFQQVSNAPITHYATAWSNNGSGITTINVAPNAPGDLLVFSAGFQNNVTITGISGGGVSSWQPITSGHSGSGTMKSIEMWRGVVGTTGASTITVTFSGGAGTTDFAVDEYSMGSAYGTWSIDNSATQFNSSSTTITYPSLTPQSNNELYAGYGYDAGSSPAAGSTSGYSYRVTTGGVVAYNASTTSGVATQPTASQASSTSYTIGATILAFTNNNVIINSPAGQAGNFNVTAATSGSVAGVLQAYNGGSGDILDLRAGTASGPGALVGSVGSTGAVLFKNSVNSTTAFEIQNSSGTSIFNVDTTNAKIGTRNETAASTNSSVLTIKSGDASGSTSNTGNLVVGTGNATGTSGNITLDVGTGATTGTISIGTSNASGVAISRVGITTTVQGNLAIGSSAGSGTTLTNNGATYNATLALTDFATGGSIGTAANTVDKYTSISVAQTTASQTLTIPAPTSSTNYGRIVYISNIGTASFTMLGSTLNPGATATLMWANKNGGAAWVYAGADGNAILNQNSADQSADFRISGTGRANTGLQSPNVDAISGTLNIATGASGSGALSVGKSGQTATFNGAVTVSQLLTGNAGATISGGALSLTGNAASSLTTSAGALTITSAAAATWSTAAGNLTLDAAAALNLGTTNATSVSISKAGVTTTVNGALTVSQLLTGNAGATISGGAVSITGNAASSFTTSSGALTITSAAAATWSTAAGNLTVDSAATLNLGTTNATGVSISKAGTTTTVNGNLTSGASAGSGTTFTNNGSTVNSTLALSDFATGGSIGTAANTVDKYTAISVAQTTAGQTLTIPTPTASTTYGRVVYVSNIGTTAFTLLGSTLNPNASATIIWTNTNGAASWVYSGADGSSILNQNTADQSANFRISGTGRANTGLQSPNVDAISGTLNIATGASGSGAISLGKSGQTATFNGAVTVTQLLTGNAGATISGGAISLTGNAASSLTTTAGALTITSAAAAVWSTSAGNLTVDSAASLNLGTTNATAVGISKAGVTTTVYGALTVSQLLTGNAGATVSGGALSLTGNAASSLTTTSGALTVTSAAAATWSTSAGNLTVDSAATLNLGTTNATAVSISKTGVLTTVNGSLTVSQVSRLNGNVGINIGAATPTADLTFGENAGAGRTINVLTRTTNAAGEGLTVSAGAGGAGAGANTGGALTLQGGAAGGTGAVNGGAVYISGGAASGGGNQGLVNMATTAFTSASTFTASSAGVNNISVSDVNTYSTIPVTATLTTAIVSVPDPTSNQDVPGRMLYISALNGSTDFTLRLNGATVPIDIAMKQNTAASLVWNGDRWTAAGASSSTDLQSAYNNTLTSAGGAEIVLNPVGGNADGFTIRNNGTTPIMGGLLEVQTAVGSNLLSVNNNATEYASNGGAESATLTGWGAAPAGGTATKYTTAGDNIATGQASVYADTTSTANTGVKNTLNASLTQNLKYKVSFSARNATATPAFTTLQAIYSADGTSSTATCSTSNGAITSFTSYYNVWTRVDCTFTATSVGASNAIIIRHSDGTEHDFYIDNLSVTVSADVNHAADGDADSAANIGGGTNNWAAISSATVSQVTSPVYNTNGAVSVVTSATAGRGVYNKLANNITPTASSSTLVYRVSFYARGDGTNTANLDVKYSADGSNNADCQDFNTQTVSATTYTLISCYFRTNTTTPTSSAQLKITQTGGSATTFYVDGLAVNLNTNTSSNVQVGGANKGGPTTLLTLDRASSAPIAANNDAYLGSMYYDTTTGRIQCYEADGWGACGSSPDIFVTLTPEYTGAVLNGSGIGVMTADFCGNGAGLSVNTSLCSVSGTSRQYYKWTSPQATEQVYSIYVSYKLPSTFKSFTSDDTINLTARTSDTTTGHVTYEVFKSTGAALTACGSATAVTMTASGGIDGPDYWSTKPINGNESTSCGFAPGDNVVFKINMKSYSNANVYVENLTFTYNNN